MAAFLYKAVDPSGRQRTGVIEAGNAATARASLREQQLLPITIETTKLASKSALPEAQADRQPLFSFLKRRKAIGGRDLALVTRQLSTLTGSDVRIEEALKAVAEQARTAHIASVLLNVRAAILDGRTFGQALAEYPETFADFYRASISAGERSGKLGPVLMHLADFVENRQRNRQTVQLALLYPALLAMVSLSIIVLLLTYVVPDIVRVFVSRGAKLPLLTRGLIVVSNSVVTYGWIAAIVFSLCALAWSRWVKAPKNRLRLHELILNSPITRRFSSQINGSQFVATLATLVQSDVQLVDALKAASAVTPNMFVRQKIATITTRVQEGVSLRAAINEAKCFPPMITAMVASGEKSGSLGLALSRAATDQQQELDARVKVLVALVEPAILLLMGGIVLTLVLSIMLPIIGLNNLAGH